MFSFERIAGFVSDDPQSAPLQGQDTIIIHAPKSVVWPLIADSKRLEDWGPPVINVEILDNLGKPETVGSYRHVDANVNGKVGYFIERRIEQVEGQRMRFVMENESFGLSKILKDVGAEFELEEIDEKTTRVIFSFYHTPKGLIGKLINKFIILRQQRKNRRLALDSLQAYAESLL